MQQYIKPSRTLLAVLCAATVAATACGDKKTDTALATDTALSRDLAMAARDSAVQPQLQDVPVAPPVEPTPTPAAPKPRPAAPKPKPAPAASGCANAGSNASAREAC